MKKNLLLLTTIAFIGLQSLAQDINAVIQLDGDVKHGKLANGLTYYIRKNARPENRVEMRLVVNAGAVLEKDNQQGIAHFLEHMAFNGTRNFPKGELLNYLEKAGVRFGADLNATTGFDYTIYMLPIPSNDAGLLNNGYQVLRDWAGNLLLDKEEIEKERGIIIEEKRMRQNAGQRAFTQYLPALTNNSQYGHRIPIGKEEIITTAPRQVFADYYRDWYRPDNMAVIVVGDIDPVAAEAKIKALFANLKNPAGAPKRPAITPIIWHKANQAKLVSDAENTNNTLSVYFDMKIRKNDKTWNSYRDNIITRLITDLFSGRLKDNLVNPQSPLSYAAINPDGSFFSFKGYTISTLFAVVKDKPADALKLVVGEVLKAQQFGFTEPELERVKKAMLKSYDEGLAEKEKTESAQYTGEYIGHFLYNEPSPGIAAEHAFTQKIISQLTVSDINTRLRALDLNKPVFILYNTTEAQKNSITETELLQVFEQARQQQVTAYTETKVADQLMDKAPAPGKITSRTTNQDFASTTLTLSNGISVIYKKTDFKNDEIAFKGSQWGGCTNYTPEEIMLSRNLMFVSALGVGQVRAGDMPKIMSGVDARVAVNLLQTYLLLSGGCSARDLEMFLQLLHLRLTDVNFNKEDFEGIQSAFANQFGNMLKNPSMKFSDTLNQVRYNYSNRINGFPIAENMRKLQPDELKNFYRKITANLNGLVLTFSGNIDEAVFLPLIEKYVASIPTGAQPVALNRENIPSAIAGDNSFSFRMGKENKSEINRAYYGKLSGVTDREVLCFGLLGEILQIQANKKLREEMGNTYAPAVSSSMQRPPIGDYNLALIVSALPANTEKIITAFDGLIEQVMKGDWDEEDLKKAKAQRIKTLETQIRTNGYWANTLEQQHIYSIDPKAITDYAARTQSITKDDITQTARKFLGNCNKLKAVMNPE
ncbi:MAG: insulinase family protein [Chitinophagaceae bacterium]